MNKSEYGEKAEFRRSQVVVCFQCVFDRAGKHALNCDIAAIAGNKADWRNKFTIQLSIDELSLLLAIFTGRNQKANFAYHGPNKNNSLLVNTNTNQQNEKQFAFNFYNNGNQVGFIFLSQMECFRVYKLCLKQLCEYYEQTEVEMLNSLKSFYTLP